MAVTEEGNICLFIKSYLRLSEETSHAENRKLFVKIFSLPLQNIWRIINRIAFVLRENLSVPGSSQFSLSFASRESVRILEQI